MTGVGGDPAEAPGLPGSSPLAGLPAERVRRAWCITIDITITIITIIITISYIMLSGVAPTSMEYGAVPPVGPSAFWRQPRMLDSVFVSDASDSAKCMEASTKRKKMTRVLTASRLGEAQK